MSKKNGGKCSWGECEKCGVVPLLYKLGKGEFYENKDEIDKIKKLHSNKYKNYGKLQKWRDEKAKELKDIPDHEQRKEALDQLRNEVVYLATKLLGEIKKNIQKNLKRHKLNLHQIMNQ